MATYDHQATQQIRAIERVADALQSRNTIERERNKIMQNQADAVDRLAVAITGALGPDAGRLNLVDRISDLTLAIEQSHD